MALSVAKIQPGRGRAVLEIATFSCMGFIYAFALIIAALLLGLGSYFKRQKKQVAMPREIRARGKRGFVRKLLSYKSDVGTRLKRRNPEDKENFVIKHYYLLLAEADSVAYPIAISKGESPDYTVSEGQAKYGLEITESTFEAYQYLLTEHERRGDCWFEPDVFRYGGEYTKENVLRYLKPSGSPLVGPGVAGHEGEDNASGWAAESLIKKLLTVSKWPEDSRRSLRILLYQNCPGSVHDMDAFATFFKNRMAKLAPPDADRAIKVDYLTSNGKMLAFDLLGQTKTFGQEPL